MLLVLLPQTQVLIAVLVPHELPEAQTPSSSQGLFQLSVKVHLLLAWKSLPSRDPSYQQVCPNQLLRNLPQQGLVDNPPRLDSQSLPKFFRRAAKLVPHRPCSSPGVLLSHMHLSDGRHCHRIGKV